MKAKIFRTAKNSRERLSEIGTVTLQQTFDTTIPVIAINPQQRFQTHIGFGGAFTEAAAYTLSEVSKDIRAEAIKAYYDPENGIGYTMGRTTIHSSDFSLENYTYVSDGDNDLASFDLSREDKWVIPMIRDAKSWSKTLDLLASPWSPPAWMKTNNNMNFGGKLLPEHRLTWANYFVKYLDHMKDRGVDFWAVSVQNEPAATQVWDSCIYSAEEERDFLKNYLGPVLEASNHDIKVLVWDHNRDIIVERAATILLDKDAARYVFGVAMHWYVSEAFENLSVVHNMFPDTHIVFTEGCQEGGPHVGSWKTGERYARNIIGDLNNWVEGWIDWNLVLNELGGPNHVNNLCDAPILVDRNENKLIYNSSYYYIGHFSKFIRPKAVRIGCISNAQPLVRSTAYQNTDGGIVLVVQNESDSLQSISIALGQQGFTLKLPEHSITTFIIQ